MLNVLIFDPEACCSSILRCILRGRGFRTSISHDVEDAGRKFETGLFDIIFVDASAEPETCALFTESLLEMAPGVPVILLYRGEPPAFASHVKLFKAIAKPIRVGAISRAVEQATQSLSLVEHRRWPRRAVDFAVEIVEGEERVTCHATNLSLGGILVESIPKDEAALLRFHQFFAREHTRTLLASLPAPDGVGLKLTGTVAFAERAQDQNVCHVGIAFVGMPGHEREVLERFLQGAA